MPLSVCFFITTVCIRVRHCKPLRQDETNIQQEWANLAESHKLDLVICIAAALKRGNLTEDEANRYDREQHNIHAPFELSGLGQLLDAQLNSDQIITFG